MGLDVSYFASVKRAGDVPDDGDYDCDLFVDLFPNPDFEARADGLTEGLYETAGGDGFGCGAYSSYNRWRRWLAGLAGYTDEDAWAGRVDQRAPFLPLVDFSDCEGAIGPVTSQRLAADFAAFDDKVTANDPNRRLFDHFKTAFETASNGGAVLFH